MKRWKISILIIFIFILMGCGQAGNEVVEVVESTNTPEPTLTLEPTVTLEPTPTFDPCNQLAFSGTYILQFYNDSKEELFTFRNDEMIKISGDLNVRRVFGYFEDSHEILLLEKNGLISSINLDNSEITQVSSIPLGASWGSLSPDKKSIAFTITVEDVSDLYVYDLELDQIIEIPNTDYKKYSGFSWHPDSSSIFYVSGEDDSEIITNVNIESGEK